MSKLIDFLFDGTKALKKSDKRDDIEPSPAVQLNIDGERDDLSGDPFYGDEAIKKRIKEGEQQ